jgi:hypothetical protein
MNFGFGPKKPVTRRMGAAQHERVRADVHCGGTALL